MIVIEKWAGLITAASPYALPGGAMVQQINVQCLKPGQLQCRSGHTLISNTPTPGLPVVSMERYSIGQQDKMIALVGNTLSLITP